MIKNESCIPIDVNASLNNPDYWSASQVVHPVLVSTPPINQALTFHAYVNTLEPWEIDVLQMTTMQADPTDVCKSLSHGLRPASDGSVRFMTQGAFGWALSTDQGVQAATGMGPARGPQPSSYRSEAYGLLSLLRFLVRLAEFTNMVDQWDGVLAKDSKSVLKTLGGGYNFFCLR